MMTLCAPPPLFKLAGLSLRSHPKHGYRKKRHISPAFVHCPECLSKFSQQSCPHLQCGSTLARMRKLRLSLWSSCCVQSGPSLPMTFIWLMPEVGKSGLVDHGHVHHNGHEECPQIDPWRSEHLKPFLPMIFNGSMDNVVKEKNTRNCDVIVIQYLWKFFPARGEREFRHSLRYPRSSC